MCSVRILNDAGKEHKGAKKRKCLEIARECQGHHPFTLFHGNSNDRQSEREKGRESAQRTYLNRASFPFPVIPKDTDFASHRLFPPPRLQ